MLNDTPTLRVGVLCSKRAPGLDELLRHPSRGTRSTIHNVTEKVDGGPLVLVSGPYPVAPFVHGVEQEDVA